MSLCINGAAVMTGKIKEVRSENPDIQIIQRFIHAKSLQPDLKSALDNIVKLVNLIKRKPLQLHLFSILCDKMGSDHPSWLFHTKV